MTDAIGAGRNYSGLQPLIGTQRNNEPQMDTDGHR